ncbi:MAG: DUF5691 domain-containing protein [Bacteroidia bacterium]
MSFQKEIIKTAILGTSKYTPKTNGSVLTAEIEQIKINTKDQDEALLKASFLALNYFEAGAQFKTIKSENSTAPAEDQAYAPLRFQRAFESALNKGNARLIDFAVQQLYSKSLIISAQIVPSLLDFMVKNKALAKPVFLKCLGLRAQWLAQYNVKWQKLYSHYNDSEDWELMDFESRKQYLWDLRKSEPAKVSQLLSATIQQENANNRYILLEILEENLGIYDQEFLLTLLKDKSKKVQSKVCSLLQKIQGSIVNQAYTEHFLNAINIKSEQLNHKSNPHTLHVNEQKPSNVLFDFGLEPISSKKGFSDHLFWMAQCMAVVNPNAITKKYLLSKQDIFKLFIDNSNYDLLLPYLIKWAFNFNNALLANMIINKSGLIELKLLDILPENQRENIIINYLQKKVSDKSNSEPGLVLNHLIQLNKPINYNVTVYIVRALKVAPYLITADQYKQLAYLIPISHKNNLQDLAHRIGDGHFELRFLKNQLFEMLYILEQMERLTIT